MAYSIVMYNNVYKSVGTIFVQHPSGGFFLFDKKRVAIITI